MSIIFLFEKLRQKVCTFFDLGPGQNEMDPQHCIRLQNTIRRGGMVAVNEPRRIQSFYETNLYYAERWSHPHYNYLFTLIRHRYKILDSSKEFIHV